MNMYGRISRPERYRPGGEGPGLLRRMGEELSLDSAARVRLMALGGTEPE